jgi:acetylornithine/succinyldiaminopimelate/putrescine aminotransferase
VARRNRKRETGEASSPAPGRLQEDPSSAGRLAPLDEYLQAPGAMIFTHGRGCYVYDQKGRAYLDFLGGIAVNALGYSYPDMVRSGAKPRRAIHISNLFHNPFQGPLAAQACEMVRDGPRIFHQ